MAPSITNVDPIETLINEHKGTQRQWPWLESLLIAGLLLIAVACVVARRRDEGTVVATRDIARGEAISGENVVLAPLPRMSGTFSSVVRFPKSVAARAIEAGQPVRRGDVVQAVASLGEGEVEVPLQVYVGPLRPAPGALVRLAAVDASGSAFLADARVLSLEAKDGRGMLDAAMAGEDAERFATLHRPDVRLMVGPAKGTVK
jgi:hypothetical protein